MFDAVIKNAIKYKRKKIGRAILYGNENCFRKNENIEKIKKGSNSM
jgi:hypothetical protein